jgi:hypothetical protein
MCMLGWVGSIRICMFKDSGWREYILTHRQIRIIHKQHPSSWICAVWQHIEESPNTRKLRFAER